ncbi:hypothetical protein BDV36DRAFT_242567 [Aspergillus pseudocaelatus]|uniref:Uncharacterized protein n=1 Tax=Aspergillus pseudocaelatus TaxID=1825620 RepID=A0ABQ6X2A4_9EURO|nr:hypothetical protein BDV36DRAFT_242567 [Aspergillus pseudocaelatus]
MTHSDSKGSNGLSDHESFESIFFSGDRSRLAACGLVPRDGRCSLPQYNLFTCAMVFAYLPFALSALRKLIEFQCSGGNAVDLTDEFSRGVITTV